MNRIKALEKNQAPWHLRWFYGVMRKMFGKDLTPVKQQMHVPGLVWGSIGMEAGLSRIRSGSYSTGAAGDGRAPAEELSCLR